MGHHSSLWLAVILATPFMPSYAQTAGSIVQGGNTVVSAMMAYLANDEKIYFLDKVEENSITIDGHPAWLSVYDIATQTAEAMEGYTNQFCAAGMHHPNGSLLTFGGNGAIGPQASIGSINNGYDGSYDVTLEDADGRTVVRLLNPCTGDDIPTRPECQWIDHNNTGSTTMQLQVPRWYPTAEPLADGTLIVFGGFSSGGYICRNTPYDSSDPSQGGACQPNYEFYPSRGPPVASPFIALTGGLQSYAHMFLMASGLMFAQANVSTMLLDMDNNIENYLPNVPDNVVKVYPASAATAMLPLTPANNYSQTIIFCGGQNLTDEEWGNFTSPAVDVWNYPASTECVQITPEPSDGSAPEYTIIDSLPIGRSMGQFIHLPDGTMLIINGAGKGTAGYSDHTPVTPELWMQPFGESMSSDPVLTPVLYNPEAPLGSRFTSEGFSAAQYPRLYHSSALLLPDASVICMGSNPNIYTNLSTVFPTTYMSEIFYPPYFNATTRPTFTGVPQALTYGGNYFSLNVSASSYTGDANDAADNTVVRLIRPGFTTHAMNMGQRSMQLNSTSTVNSDGTITLYVSQPPPNANILQPGPVMVFVTINGVPSNGTFTIVGTGNMEVQPTSPQAPLPPSVRLSTAGTGNGSSGSDNASNDTASSSSNTGAIVGGIVGAIAVVGILGAALGICLARRRRAAAKAKAREQMQGGMDMSPVGNRNSDGTLFMPLRGNDSMAWNSSMQSLHTGYPASPASPGSYQDDKQSQRAPSREYDPYYDQAPGAQYVPQQLQPQRQQQRHY